MFYQKELTANLPTPRTQKIFWLIFKIKKFKNFFIKIKNRLLSCLSLVDINFGNSKILYTDISFNIEMLIHRTNAHVYVSNDILVFLMFILGENVVKQLSEF